MQDFFLKENQNFEPYTIQHLLILLFIVIFGITLIKWAKKQPEKTQVLTGNIFAFTISLVVIMSVGIKIYSNDFDVKEDLPLHLCSLIALIIPLLSLTRNFLYYEIFFFLVLTGTFQSTITPSDYNFLNFPFIRYWLVHAGLVVYLLYATFVYKMIPTLKSVFKSFIGMQVYLAAMFLVNYLLGSNYFYTNSKPEVATMLDLMGDWPYYIFVVELIVIPYFLLMYLPFYLTKKKS